MVEAATEAGRPVGELVGEWSLATVEPLDGGPKGPIESLSPLRAQASVEGSLTGGPRSRQSTIPLVGDDGTAISREGMRPAR